MLKQIILISDGQSNRGLDPVEAAELAPNKDIRVNTIGIVDSKQNESPIFELENIAEKGGGICELTDLENLSETLSKVTVKSVYETIEEVVNRELKEIIHVDIEEVHPRERNKITRIIDQIGNEITLKCLILLDASGSMKKKIEIARKSIFELLMFLEERSGENQIGVMVFPGESGYYELLCDFTKDIDELKNKVKFIETGGITPTGPAIEGAIKIFSREDHKYSIYEHIV